MRLVIQLLTMLLNALRFADFWANLARFCFGLNMMTTTPLEAFVCREVRPNTFSVPIIGSCLRNTGYRAVLLPGSAVRSEKALHYYDWPHRHFDVQ